MFQKELNSEFNSRIISIKEQSHFDEQGRPTIRVIVEFSNEDTM